MKRRNYRLLQVLCVIGILVVLTLLYLVVAMETHWVGRTDLTVEFVVTDAETGEPIRGADISIQSYGGLNADGHRLQETNREKEELKLTTDEAGTARYVCRDSMSFGTSS